MGAVVHDGRRGERRRLGASALLVTNGVPLAHVVFLAFVLGGMAAGAALSNASRQSAFLAFTVPALLPILVLLLSGGDRFRVGMGVLVAVFGMAVSAIPRSGGRALAEAVRLRYTNAELTRGLAALNAELEARVTERTAQLEAARSREREAERQFASAARLAMLGSLAAGVAHEINNPLTYVRSNLSYVREELGRSGADPAAQGALDQALADAGDGVERVGGDRAAPHGPLPGRDGRRGAAGGPARHARPVRGHGRARIVQPKARIDRQYGPSRRCWGTGPGSCRCS